MKPFILLAAGSLALAVACERPTGSGAPAPRVAPTPRLNLLIERSEPSDPVERAREALRELERRFGALPAPARSRLDGRWARVSADAELVLAELETRPVELTPRDRRLELRMRAVPLSLSLFLTDLGLGLHRDQLPEELGHELTHATERAHRAWSELVSALAGHEA